jgi:hypothetical protein
MRIGRAAVLIALGALALASVAAAQVTDRYRIASDPDAQGYSRSLALVIASPPEYVLDSRGRLGNDASWKGPRYQATGRPSLGGESGLGWSAGVEKEGATRATIVANLVHDWQVIREGTEPIERRIGGRQVGAIPGRWLLTQGTVMAGEARYEAGVVIPLCGRTAYIGISALTPSGDSAGGTMGFGEYLVNGTVKPTEWNREKVLETIRGLSLDGNLPAGRITAARRGRAIAGRVGDCNGHPAAGEGVRLEQRSGSSWSRTRVSAKTSVSGTYSLRAAAPGTYRVVAGGKRSAPVTIP